MRCLRTPTLLHLVALLSILAVAIALLSQHVFNMPPCAWCVFQRLLFLAIAATCWLSLAIGGRWPAALRLGSVVSALLAAGGVMSAWYQHTVAAQQFSCDLTFADRFMVNSGLDAGLPWLFGIYATCMEARVELLGVEYALWAMVLFIALGGLALLALLRKPHHPSRY